MCYIKCYSLKIILKLTFPYAIYFLSLLIPIKRVLHMFFISFMTCQIKTHSITFWKNVLISIYYTQKNSNKLHEV